MVRSYGCNLSKHPLKTRGSSCQVFQVDAFEGLVVSVDGKTSAVKVGVEFLAAVDNSKQFPFDVCVS